jgi:endonuclease/exonuclease/phosphatase family metal-dependent hydrolase
LNINDHAVIESASGESYWYHMVVFARGPVRREWARAVPGGALAAVTARVRGRDLRLLVADGVSDPFRPRGPFLEAVAEACRTAAAGGRPFDAVLGDFNAPARCLGFDDLAAQGFRLASKAAGRWHWRGTFPSWLPLYDIDHVWLGPDCSVLASEPLTGPWSDHRGQTVRIGLPPPAPTPPAG